MAITTPALAGKGSHPIAVDRNRWAANFHSADLTAAGVSQELKATPGAGKALYLTHVTMGIVDSAAQGYLIDNYITLKDGDGTILFGPIQMQQQGKGLLSKDWDVPLKLADNKALNGAVGRAAGSYNTAALIYVEGFTGQSPIE